LGPTLQVTPNPIVAGAPIVVTANGLPMRGGTLGDDGVALGGRSLQVLAWGAREVRAAVPADVPRGFAPLVVIVDGRPWASALVETLSDTGPPDASVLPGDTSPDPDVTQPDAEARRRFEVDVVADPTPAQGFALTPLEAVPDEVRLEARATPGVSTWGVAFHLVWDPLQLELVDAEVPPDHTRAAAKTAQPGRLIFGAVLGSADAPLVTLRFRAIGRGERRVSLPAAFAEARDERNQRRPELTFAGVTVTTRAAATDGAQP